MSIEKLIQEYRAFAKECQEVIDDPDSEHELGWARGRQQLFEEAAKEIEAELPAIRAEQERAIARARLEAATYCYNASIGPYVNWNKIIYYIAANRAAAEGGK